MEDKISKIARILELSSTETRENAISSFIENVIYFFDNEALTIKDILECISELFDIQPIENEIQIIIESLIKRGDLIITQNRFKLSDEKFLQIKRTALKVEESAQQRKKRFSLLIKELGEVNEKELKLLWEHFNEYLYECFYQYGEYALNNFVQSNNQENQLRLVNGSPYHNAIKKLSNPNTREIFQKLVMYFAQKLSTEDLDYLESLANKTLSFYSLGLPKNLHQEVLNSQIDWTVLVDTNFLYSILGLHKNVETDASIELLKIVKELNLNVRFKYIPATIQELKRKKTEFDDIIPKVPYSSPQIKALLNSNRLDSFGEIYYENLLKNPETLHPSQIIDTSEKVIFHAFNIQIFNSKFEQISDDAINHSITEYEGYIQIRNEARRERGGFEEIYKHQKQIWHDVLLREAIEWLRKREVEGEVQTFSEIKYLGVTLDKLLIAFDKFELGKRRRVIPNFYTPSFLLDRIRKFAPIQTDNYKRAFITAISSFNFYDKSVKKSKDAQKFVNYYRSKGLNDEKLLLSFLTDDLFLDSFFKEETNEDDFFEAEISKKFTALQLEKEETEKKIKILKQRTDIKSNEVKIAENQIEKKDSEISELNNVLKQLKELANTNEKKAFENKNEKELYQKKVADLTNRLNQIENENKFKDDLKKYEDDKVKYINNKWNAQEKHGYKFLLHILFWSFVPIYLGIIFYYDTMYPNLKIGLGVITSFVSFILSYLNKDYFHFSRKYLISRSKTMDSYKKEYEEQYEHKYPKPLLVNAQPSSGNI